MLWKVLTRRERRLLATLVVSSCISLVFLLARIVSAASPMYWFLAWNLVLAWVPLVLSWWLVNRLKKTKWLTVGNVIITLLWLGFLPNAFYVISDLIHIRATNEIGVLYDVVMFVSFIWNGLILGYLSLYAIHVQLRRRLSGGHAAGLIGFVLLLCSFAIYLGRYLRWNSWDVLINPAGIIFDVSDPFINPSLHPQAFTTTLMFFVLLSSIYAVAYQIIAIMHETEAKK